MTRARAAAANGPIVTLDGPAGSGKSSTAKAVARRLGFRHLDSGGLYRGLTLALLESGVPEDEWKMLDEEHMRALDVGISAVGNDMVVHLGGQPISDELRTPAVTARVSRLARLPAARACLLTLQRAAGEQGHLVADGRDMGTVVFPDAEVKVYLVADLDARARRRLREGGVTQPTDEDVRAQSREIAERDRRDSERELSPLRMPEDAHLIDTTRLTFEEQVDAIVALVEDAVDASRGRV